VFRPELPQAQPQRREVALVRRGPGNDPQPDVIIERIMAAAPTDDANDPIPERRREGKDDPGRSLSDEIDVLIAQNKETAETTIRDIVLRTSISLIPYVGSAINEIADGLAQLRVQERLNDVFDAMKERLDNVTEDKVDKEYFHSEEFQTLLYLLLERLHTTHDKKKLRMFGIALGNSGLIEFKTADKESFARVLRDLSLSELQVLDDQRLKGWPPHIPGKEINYANEVLENLFRLQATGLVLSRIDSEQPPTGSTGSVRADARNAIATLTKSPRPRFYLSDFGTKFLEFIRGTK
jgi:hypothetical protein